MTDADGAGPVFSDDELVGICVQKATTEDRVGEVMPASIIHTFLAGRGTARPAAALARHRHPEHGESRLREVYGLADDRRGVLVIDVDHGGSADGVLARGDVIVAIDGIAATANGAIAYAEVDRTGSTRSWETITSAIGSPSRSCAMCGTRSSSSSVRGAPLVPRTHYDQQAGPPCLGAASCSAADARLPHDVGHVVERAPKEFLDACYRGRRTPERHELVMLSQILTDPVDFAELADTLEGATGLARIETTSGGILVMHAGDVGAATLRILDSYQIPRARSRSPQQRSTSALTTSVSL